MEINFLGQGFESVSANSVGGHLNALLINRDYHTFTAISAFISASGIRGLQNILSETGSSYKSKTVISGIDQKGTSKEALETLLATDIAAYVFYQPSSSIFHPKIYLFEGDNKSTLILGSTNLTSNGLFVNVESSLKIEVDHSDRDYKVILDLKEYFKTLFDRTDPNLKKLDQDLIDKMVSLNVVPTEDEKRKLYAKIERDDLSVISSPGSVATFFPKRIGSKIPSSFTKKSTIVGVTPLSTPQSHSSKSAKNLVTTVSATASSMLQPIPVTNLVWFNATLSSSSVLYAKTPNSNPTGGLRLVQAKFNNGGTRIDQTTYFRNVVFGAYHWATVKLAPLVEVAVVPFEIIIVGTNYGIYNLEIRHKPSGVASQGNYTTQISWGAASSVIRLQNLTGRSLSLYSPLAVNGPFQIVIN